MWASTYRPKSSATLLRCGRGHKHKLGSGPDVVPSCRSAAGVVELVVTAWACAEGGLYICGCLHWGRNRRYSPSSRLAPALNSANPSATFLAFI